MKRKMLMVLLAACLVLSGCSSGKDAEPIGGTSEEPEQEVIEAPAEEPEEVVAEEPEETAPEDQPEIQEPAEDQPVLSNYSIVRDDFSITLDNGNRAVMYFDKIVFEGSDEVLIAWLNGQMESLESTYQKESASEAEGGMESLQEWDSGTAFDYSPHELSHIFYDDNYVSVGWSCDWYAGGVSNTDYEYVNYDLNTKAELKATDLLGDNAHNSIAQALNKIDESGYLSGQFQSSVVIDDIPFYFDQDTVYLNFPSYMLDQGTGSIEVTLPRLIK